MDTNECSRDALRRGFRRAGLAALGLTAIAGGCAPQHHERVVTTRTVAVEERTVPAPKMVDISVVGLHDEPTADPTQEKVVGTIVNSGDRQVTGLTIRVDALDSRGSVLHSITTPPLAHAIDPYGGRTTFEAFMPRNDAVAEYHAVAIAR
jgi:hypothetical protein